MRSPSLRYAAIVVGVQRVRSRLSRQMLTSEVVLAGAAATIQSASPQRN